MPRLEAGRAAKQLTLVTSLLLLCGRGQSIVAELAVYNLTQFETVGLAKWEAQFALDGAGNYSWEPHHTSAFGHAPHPYSASDVAHVRCFAGQLNLSSAEADEWATRVNAFQFPPGRSLNDAEAGGFFNNKDVNGLTGGTYWHAAGYVTAGLRLIGRQPRYRNELFEQLAGNESMWAWWIESLLNADVALPPENVTSGCSSGYDCAQNIASPMAWLVMTDRNSSFLPFQRWYYQYLSAHGVDRATGLWCTPAQKQKHGVGNCIGGSFHIDFVFTHAGQPFPAPLAQLNASLALQLADGKWSESNWYLDIDGIYQVTRPSVQAGKARWGEVRQACNKLMAKVVPILNDESQLLGDVSRNSHILPALVASVAECGHWFPDMVATHRPWKLCLDEVPYI